MPIRSLPGDFNALECPCGTVPGWREAASSLALFVLDPGSDNRGFVPSHRRLVLGKKLYVGNLGYSVSNSELEKLFSAFGTVASAQVIEDRESGRSKGFGFVEMGSDQEAQAAIQGLNGKDHDGRPLTVNEARPREERGGGGRGGRGGGYGGGGGRGGRY
jgi:RNA recognition motif-containing protein